MTTYQSRMINIARQGAGRVDAFDADSFESGHRHGHKAARHAASDIACEADADIARLQAKVDALADALHIAKRTMADYGQCDNDNWPCFQTVCAALAKVGR